MSLPGGILVARHSRAKMGASEELGFVWDVLTVTEIKRRVGFRVEGRRPGMFKFKAVPMKCTFVV